MSVEVDETADGILLRELLRERLGISARLITNAKKISGVLLNEKPTWVDRIVYAGDRVRLLMHEKSEIPAEDVPIHIVHEDRDLIVLRKEPMILVHPSKKHETGTLINGLIRHAQNRGETYKPHIVNRLDRDTSGLLMIAKNPFSHYELMKQMERNLVKKKYLAITKGGFQDASGTIELRISYEKHEGINRLVSEDGKYACTHYKVLQDDGNLALVELDLVTGRTHQIRVHMSEIGHPLAGDELYGGFGMDLIDRQALHAYYLECRSPRGGELRFQSELPEDMRRILRDAGIPDSIQEQIGI